MRTLLRDFRHGLRMLAKSPGFTAVAVLTLGLGIGANTTVFSLVNTFLLRPTAGKREGELVQCYSREKERPAAYRAFSYPNYLDIRERSRVFSHLLAYELAEVVLTEGDATRRVLTCFVSANYFSAFGVTMVRGRNFRLEEEQPESAIPVVILSHAYWTASGADPEVLGKTLRIHNRPHTIVGVAPREFAGTMSVLSPPFWLPLGMRETLRLSLDPNESTRLRNRNHHCLLVAGQLKPGVNRAGAEAELRSLAGQLEAAFPTENHDQTVDVHPLPRLTVGPVPEIGSPGRAFVTGRITPMLLATAGAVLVIACLNLSNLLLARGTSRRKEIAIRLALGGKRSQVVGQLLVEAFLLSLLGGAVGLLLAYGATRLITLSWVSAMPFVLAFDATPDLRVLAATLAFCGLSTVLFGLSPAWHLSRSEIVTDLKERGDASAARDAGRGVITGQSLLLMAQLALSLTLLNAAGLFIRGAINAAHVDPGFALRNGLIVEIDPALAGYDETGGRHIYRTLLERLRVLPGVEEVSLAASVPFHHRDWRNVRRAGLTLATDRMAESAATGKSFGSDYNVIGADYFKTLGLALVRGREFGRLEGEPGSASRVAVIDQELAHRLWPGEEALGRRLEIAGTAPGQSPRVLEVVGLARTLRNSIIESRPVPHLYVPLATEYRSRMYLHLRVSPRGRESALALLRTVREEIRSVDSRLPVLSLKTLEDLPKGTRDSWLVQTGAQLFTLFGGLALLLAVVGVYGVKAFSVARRTREIGLRMALGALQRDVLWLVLREGLNLTLVGLGAGLLLAVGTGLLLRSMLYEVKALDPVTLSVAPLCLAAAALLACWLPARRAAKVDPLVALRCE